MDEFAENEASLNQISLLDTSLFQRLFKTQFQTMPKPWQIFHTAIGHHEFEGEAEVIRGKNIILQALATLLRLPPTSKVPVKLVIEKQGLGESWARYFGKSFFSTVLYLDEKKETAEDGFYLRERFGPLCFGIVLTVEDKTVVWSIDRWWFFHIPLPKFFAPRSKTKEFVDDEGRYAFDIDLSVPFLGRLIAYRGWLNVE